jgi:inner membrane protein
MDSVSQLALGAAVGMAAMGRRTALWKSALWGAVAGTLPDLDVFIDHGDAVLNMVLHRAETHAPFWLTLFSLPFATAVAWLHGEQALWRRWWLALWLALVTHPLLDAMTVYGTQLALPYSNRPLGVGSVFIIDPLYTLPLLVGAGIALGTRRLGANTAGLALSGFYLAWGVAAQQHVRAQALEALAARGIAAERVLVTPTAFNSVLWRVVAVEREHFHEGYVSLLDAPSAPMTFDRFERGVALAPSLAGNEAFARIAAFSHGFYKLSRLGERVLVTDLRMGQEPHYTFSFAIAREASPLAPLVPSQQVGSRPDLRRWLPWLWQPTPSATPLRLSPSFSARPTAKRAAKTSLIEKRGSSMRPSSVKSSSILPSRLIAASTACLGTPAKVPTRPPPSLCNSKPRSTMRPGACRRCEAALAVSARSSVPPLTADSPRLSR